MTMLIFWLNAFFVIAVIAVVVVVVFDVETKWNSIPAIVYDSRAYAWILLDHKA